MSREWDNLAKQYYEFAQTIASCKHQDHCISQFGRCDETPQFRPLGKNYLKYRILVLSENPGGKPGMNYGPDGVLMDKYRKFAASPDYENWKNINNWLLDEALPHFAMGKYLQFLSDLGVQDMHQVAHLTVAYCRLKDDKKKTSLLRYCFEKYMKTLVADVLTPNYVIAIGMSALKYTEQATDDSPCIIRAVLHWSQKNNTNRARLRKRQAEIHEDLLKYMSHVDAGKVPRNFRGNPHLSSWPSLNTSLAQASSGATTVSSKPRRRVVPEVRPSSIHKNTMGEKHPLRDLFEKLGRASGRVCEVKTGYLNPEKIILRISGRNVIPYWSKKVPRTLEFWSDTIKRFLPAGVYGRLDNKNWYAIDEKMDFASAKFFLNKHFDTIVAYLKIV